MSKAFDFEVVQMRYIKAAMDEIPTFQPDGKTAADVQTMIDTAEAVRATFQNADVTLALARGELAEATDGLHTACVQVYAIMKNRFRADPGSLQAINRLPVHDRTTRDTLARSESLSALWGQLPNPPGSATPFVAWSSMDKTAFDALLTATRTQFQGFAAIDQDYQVAQGKLHDEIERMEDFTTAALITGRAQFAEGSFEREVIDAVPTQPAQQEPQQAVIGVANSPGAGQTHLEYSAAGATSYDVLERLAGEPDFALVAEDVIATSYNGSGLADGIYEYQVVGRNSRGAGPASATASIPVGGGVAVTLTVEWNAGTSQADASWTESSAPNVQFFELRGTIGTVYDEAASQSISSHFPATLNTSTIFGLLSPGDTATFKIIVHLTTGETIASNAVTITRV